MNDWSQDLELAKVPPGMPEPPTRNTQHTGVVVSVKEADAWHADIKRIMAGTGCKFEQACDLYIEQHRSRPAARVVPVDQTFIDD